MAWSPPARQRRSWLVEQAGDYATTRFHHLRDGTTGRWCYLYRAIDRDGDLVDTMLSEHRDMAAARAFFRSAMSATGVTPDRVTTDGHGSYPRAIRSTLGRRAVHRTSAYRNNGLEQDHRRVKRLVRPGLGFGAFRTARRTLAGYEAMAMVRKGQVRGTGGRDVRAQASFVAELSQVAA